MTRDEIATTLLETMQGATQEEVDWEAMDESAKIADLGFDSLSILDLVYDVQQAFKVSFDAEELAGVKTVNDLITFLEQRVD